MKEEVWSSPSQVKQLLKLYWSIGLAACLHGMPGIGKSEMIDQLAREMGAELVVLRLVTRDPVDLTGVPYLEITENGKVTRWAPTELFPRFKENDEKQYILFADELNRAAVMTMNAAMQMFWDRCLNEIRLAKNCHLVAACNLEGVGVQPVPDALNNRFGHIFMKENVDDFCQWCLHNGIDPLVIGYNRWKPEHLAMYDKKAKAFPTPRVWAKTSEVINSPIYQQMDKDSRLAAVTGILGHGVGGEFEAFCRLYSTLPSIDAILMDPSGTKVPATPDALFAIASALAHKATPDNFERCLTYLERMAPEYAVMSIKDSVAKNPAVAKCKAFINWVSKNASLMQ